MDYTLEIDGQGTKSLPQWGINAATAVHTSLGLDTLTLVVAQRLDAPSLIAPYGRAILRDENGAARFVGWMDAPRRAVTGGKEEWLYTLSGPTRWLRRIPYRAPRWGLAGFKDSGVVTLGAKTEMTVDGARTTPIDLGEQLVAVITCAAAGGAPIAATINVPAPKIPWERRINDSCDSALLALLQWMPEAAGWWDLANVAQPRLRLRTGGTSRTCSEQLALTAADLTPRFDDLWGSVQVDYIYQPQISGEVDESLLPFVPDLVVTQSAPAGPDGSSLGAPVLYRAIELQAGETPPALDAGLTIAAAVASYAGTLRHDAQFTCRAINWDRIPGDRWVWGGALAAMGGYSVAQTISRDLFTGRETIVVGSPKHLGIDGLFALWQRRSRSQDGGSPAPPPGGGGQRGNSATSGGFGKVKVTIGPLAVRTAARWQISPRPAKSSGDTLTSVPIGSQTVTFNKVPGWVEPDPITVTVEKGNTAEVPDTEALYTQPDLSPLQLIQYDASHVRLVRSLVNGEILEVWNAEDDAGHPLLQSASGPGVAYFKFTREEGGDITAEIQTGTTTPDNTPGSNIFYVQIGSWTRTVGPAPDHAVTLACQNDLLGPVTAETCPIWLTSPQEWTWKVIGGGAS